MGNVPALTFIRRDYFSNLVLWSEFFCMMDMATLTPSPQKKASCVDVGVSGSPSPCQV